MTEVFAKTLWNALDRARKKAKQRIQQRTVNQPLGENQLQWSASVHEIQLSAASVKELETEWTQYLVRRKENEKLKDLPEPKFQIKNKVTGRQYIEAQLIAHKDEMNVFKAHFCK